jgi:hypothetical protein
VKKAHRKSGIGDSNHQNIAGFKTPIEVTPIEGRETLKSFLWEEKFPDREIGEFQETRKTQSQTELRKLVKLKCLSFLFVLVINVVDYS